MSLSRIKLASANRLGVIRGLVCMSSILIIFWPAGFQKIAARNGINHDSTFDPISVGAAQPEESARAELEQLQKKNGLTIGIFNRKGIGVLRFRQRSFAFRKLLVDWDFANGGISQDGTEVFLMQPLRKPRSLVIARTDGSDLRQYDEFLDALPLCWSYDNSRLVVLSPGSKLQLLELKSRLAQDIPIDDLPNVGFVTSQCWSPDGKQIVYQSTNGNVFVYNFDKRNSTKLAKGTGPTWSPDGDWIAYRDGDIYCSIHPSGEGRRELFHKSRAASGLYWSPDSRFVAYVREDFVALSNRLMIRRIKDGSEDWVAGGGDVGAGDNYQWVTNPQLLQQVELAATKR
jgi:WD40 repeat protein